MTLLRDARLVAFSVVALVSACAPSRIIERHDDRLLNERTVVGDGHGRVARANVRADADGATIVLTSQETCQKTQEKVFHRTNVTERHVNKAGAIFFYLAAAAGVGAGVGLVTDAALNVPADGNRLTSNPVGQTGAYAIGGTSLGIGAVFLALGVATSARARNSVADGGTISLTVDGSAKMIECHQGPLADHALSLITTNADGAERRVEIGKTDQKGQLTVVWSALPQEMFASANWPSRGSLSAETAVREVDLAPARAWWMDRAWKEAQATNTPAGYHTFSEHYPEAHAEEAKQHYAIAWLAGADGDMQTALAKRDLPKAQTILKEWTDLDPQGSRRAERAKEVAALERDLKVSEQWNAFDVAVGALAKADDPSESFAAAEKAISEIEKLAPGDTRLKREQKRLGDVKKKLAERSLAANIGDLQELDGDGMIDILRGDVVSQHKLAEQYDTELKMHDFKHSKEYGKLVAELKAKRKELIGTRGYVKFRNKGAYDFKRGIVVLDWPDQRSNGPRVVNGFYFAPIPCDKTKEESWGSDEMLHGAQQAARILAGDSCEIHLHVSRELARKFEGVENVDVYLLLTIGEPTKVSHKRGEPGGGRIVEFTDTAWEVAAKKPVMIITAEGSDRILFRKSY